jgi:SPP1 gp7 family putative phage head morphogenesis protein
MKLTIAAPASNTEAAAYLRGKAAAQPETFGRLPAELRARAFTAARVNDLEVLRSLIDRVAQLPEGGDWRQIRSAIAAEVSPFLEETPDGRPSRAARARAEIIVRSQGFQAYGSARYAQQAASKAAMPYWQYLTVGDSSVRTAHAALDGKILPADDPFWKDHYPPWDYGCRCIVAALTREEVEKVQAEDADKDPADRRVLEGEALQRARDGELSRGMRGTVDLRPPAATGDPQAYRWTPGSALPDLARMQASRTPEEWELLKGVMQKDTVRDPDGRDVSVWEFAGGE